MSGIKKRKRANGIALSLPHIPNAIGYKIYGIAPIPVLLRLDDMPTRIEPTKTGYNLYGVRKPMRVERGIVTQSSIDEFLEGAYYSSGYDPASMTLALGDYARVSDQVIRGTSGIPEGCQLTRYINPVTGRVMDIDASKDVPIGVIIFE